MIIKKYIADTMNEALNMIRYELGPEAVIVSRRNIKPKGILGIFKPNKLEITAAVDDVHIKERKPPQAVFETPLEKEAEIEKKEVERELTEVKEMLQRLVEEKKVKRDRRVGIKKLLLERDVNEEVVNSIIDEIKKREDYKNPGRIPDALIIEEVVKSISVNSMGKGRVQAFIGPTGVGKTTTIAKIAAIHALNTMEKVGLMTIDTYRIGAVEQLQTYADILGIPFQVLNSVNDIESAMEKFKDCDRVFVDTTGRSTKNTMQLSELKMYLDRIKPDDIHLVVSMTTKYKDLIQILKGFGAIGYKSLILTKFDETTTYGSILNAAYKARVPISFITVGQNVPDDIEEAKKERLLDLIIGEGVI